MRDSSSAPPRLMREPIEIEIARRAPVETRQQVLVERRRHAERIVVGELQHGIRLDEIEPEQQRVAGTQRRADVAQQRRRLRRIEVADVRSEKQHHRLAARKLRVQARQFAQDRRHTSRGWW